MGKSPDAFRTISEVADWLDTPAHVLRFWESKFTQVKPVKRAGGRRYYRPADMALLGGIKKLLHDDGLTIKGVQKVLREQGVRHVASLSEHLVDEDGEDAAAIADAPFVEVAEEVTEATVVAFNRDAVDPVAPAEELAPALPLDLPEPDVDSALEVIDPEGAPMSEAAIGDATAASAPAEPVTDIAPETPQAEVDTGAPGPDAFPDDDERAPAPAPEAQQELSEPDVAEAWTADIPEDPQPTSPDEGVPEAPLAIAQEAQGVEPSPESEPIPEPQVSEPFPAVAPSAEDRAPTPAPPLADEARVEQAGPVAENTPPVEAVAETAFTTTDDAPQAEGLMATEAENSGSDAVISPGDPEDRIIQPEAAPLPEMASPVSEPVPVDATDRAAAPGAGGEPAPGAGDEPVPEIALRPEDISVPDPEEADGPLAEDAPAVLAEAPAAPAAPEVEIPGAEPSPALSDSPTETAQEAGPLPPETPSRALDLPDFEMRPLADVAETRPVPPRPGPLSQLAQIEQIDATRHSALLAQIEKLRALQSRLDRPL